MKNKIRTEEEILKDFEKLGWIVVDNNVDLVLKRLYFHIFNLKLNNFKIF